MMQTEKFTDRDVSWIEFNGRVLEEAIDPDTPLMEKLKFLAIFSGNTDEFFMVRIAGIMREGIQNGDPASKTKSLFERLRNRLQELVKRQYDFFGEQVLPALEEHGFYLCTGTDLKKKHQKKLDAMFEKEILPVLTPIALSNKKPLPEIPNLSLVLLVHLQHDTQERYAIVEVPPNLPRFLVIKSSKGKKYRFIPMECVIAANLEKLFSGCIILDSTVFRLTRDMNFALDSEPMNELIGSLHNVFEYKSKRDIIRMEVNRDIAPSLLQFLQARLNIGEKQISFVDGINDLTALTEIMEHCDDSSLFDGPMPPLPSRDFSPAKSMFNQIAKKHDALLNVPYESFDPVLQLLEEAAQDPDVLAIKQTIYRAGRKSPIIQILRRAAENGKKVTVLFEIKARFDEENNLQYGSELEEAGVNVLYGISGLKVHCKALLIVRREGRDIHRYVHLSTGNYNVKTARQYTDIGYFTDNPDVADDISNLFNVITGISDPPKWKKILVAPFTLRSRLLAMIDREADLSADGEPGLIRIKANALLDNEVIEHLYAAARKGVRIEMVIRGICALNTTALPKDAAKNIRIVSIVDRFLEHARIYIFGNGGKPEYYVGSADLMPRNLDRRIEVLFPVEQRQLRKQLDTIMDLELNDCRKGRELIGENTYTSTCNGDLKEVEHSRSQYAIYGFYKKRLERNIKGKGLKK